MIRQREEKNTTRNQKSNDNCVELKKPADIIETKDKQKNENEIATNNGIMCSLQQQQW